MLRLSMAVSVLSCLLLGLAAPLQAQEATPKTINSVIEDHMEVVGSDKKHVGAVDSTTPSRRPGSAPSTATLLFRTRPQKKPWLSGSPPANPLVARRDRRPPPDARKGRCSPAQHGKSYYLPRDDAGRDACGSSEHGCRTTARSTQA